MGPAQLARVVGRRVYKGNICRPGPARLLRGCVGCLLTAGVAITQSRVDECPGQPSARGTPRSAIPFVSVRPVSPSALGSRGQPPLTNSSPPPSPAHVSSHIRPFTLSFLRILEFLPGLALWSSAASWTSSHPATCCCVILCSLLHIPASFHATC